MFLLFIIQIFKRGSSPAWLRSRQCSGHNSKGIEVEITTKMKNAFKDTCVDLCSSDLRPFTAFTCPYFTNIVQVAIDLGAKNGSVNANELLCDRTALPGSLKAKAESARNMIMPKKLMLQNKNVLLLRPTFGWRIF